MHCKARSIVDIGSVAVLLALSGCAMATSPGCTSETTVDSFVHDGWLLGSTTADMEQRFGPPIRMRVEQYENRHVEGQIDEIHVLSWDGLVLTFYEVHAVPRRELLMTASITGGQYAVGWGLAVGVPKSRLRCVLGKASEVLTISDLRARMPEWSGECSEKECAWAYAHSIDNSEVIFTLTADRVSRIDWAWYVD